MTDTLLPPGNDAAEQVAAEIEAFAGRMIGSYTGFCELLTVHLGRELGLYAALRDLGASAPAEVAAATGTDERYVREWLEQQAVAGVLRLQDNGERRYVLPAGHAEVLLNADGPAYFGEVARMPQVLAGSVLPALTDAFRSGGGVPLDVYGDVAREVQAAINRPGYLAAMGSAWIPALPDVHARLQSGPSRILDVGCGYGWAAIALAQAYPLAQVDGIDLDDASIVQARRNAAEAGVDGRVRFEVRDAADPRLDGPYDLVVALEVIHDLARPVETLRAMRRLAGEHGAVLVADEAVAEGFRAPGDDIERFLYTASVLVCLPISRVEEESAATGTAMRASTFESYATEAGYRGLNVVDISHPIWRFYRLQP